MTQKSTTIALQYYNDNKTTVLTNRDKDIKNTMVSDKFLKLVTNRDKDI